jgi:glycosyltransferase involved in cell wall biosynthesis
MRLAINGRFLTQPTTGVQRYAREVVSALDLLLSAGQIDGRALTVELLVPPNLAHVPFLSNITLKQVGRLTGHAWEQVELPFYTHNRSLLNLCNTAPLAKRDQFVVIHDAAVFAMPRTFSRPFRLWYQLLLPSLGKVAQHIVTVSEFSRSELVRYRVAPTDKLSVVPESGEHILRVQPDTGILEEHGLGRRPFVFAVSSLNPSKNFAALARAAELLDRPKFDIVIAGGTNPNVFHQSPDALPEHVLYLGYVSDQELRALYDHAACFIYPSAYEGFGLPPLEAMACGCPVIASKAASVPEICGDAALYCDPQNPWDIADKLLHLMSDSKLQLRLRAKGLEHVARFTWKSCAEQLFRIVMSRGSSSSLRGLR